MSMKRSYVSRFLSRFRRDERGAVTIEAVLWMPLFMLVLCLIADATMIYSNRAQAMRIVQDANRAYAVGRLADDQETMDFIRQRLAFMTNAPVVRTTNASGIITTVVELPANDIDAVGAFTALTNFMVAVSSQHMDEV